MVLDENEQNHNRATPHYKDNHEQADFLAKPPLRSFSFDVGSVSHLEQTLNTSNLFLGEYFDTTPSYTQQCHPMSNTNSNNNAYNSLFGFGETPTKSIDTLRSKSWSQFITQEDNSPQPQQSSNNLWNNTSKQTEAPHYDNHSTLGRLPHGWSSIDHCNRPKLLINQTSSSYKSNPASNVMPPVADICRQFYQYEYCALEDQCPYLHISLNHMNANRHFYLETKSVNSNRLLNQQQSTPTLKHSNSLSSLTTASQHPFDTTLLHHSSSHTPSSQFISNPIPSSNVSSLHSTTHRPVFYPCSTNNQLDRFQDIRPASSYNCGESVPLNMHYSNETQLVDLENNIYELCKDQNGCRFLQFKLDESVQNVSLIYKVVHIHFVELMTDPFGNYLCQKLLERCDETQRSKLIEIIVPKLFKICSSMHGTRAVQKLIDYVSTKAQIESIIQALEPYVVPLIKDLNGNHVIQKFLHRLGPDYNQFIYNTISKQCIEVATHKHGCCVYQRCIDYATELQKTQLAKVITQYALPLVQDPFGNYVVQYILSLNNPAYHDDLIRKFIEPVRELSIQKFSSNVIEKCIRVAERETRRLLIDGIIQHPNMEVFLRDSYANYVIQTCLDYSDEDQRVQFVERIRPILPSIRYTPYGKRIYSRIGYQDTQLALGMNTLSINTTSSTSTSSTITTISSVPHLIVQQPKNLF